MQNQHVPMNVYDAFNRHDPAAVAACYAEDAVAIDPVQPQPLRGREAIRRDWDEFFTAFPDVRVELVSVMTDGGTTAWEAVARGTHRGPLPTPAGPIPATGRTFELRGSHFAEQNERGEITVDRRYYDVAGLLQQLGVASSES